LGLAIVYVKAYSGNFYTRLLKQYKASGLQRIGANAIVNLL